MEYGLYRESIKSFLEDALRHDENLTKESVIEAVTTAIDENNKKLKTDLANIFSKRMENFTKELHKQSLKRN